MVEGVVEGGGRRPGQRGEAQHGRLHVLHPGHRGVSDLVSQSVFTIKEKAPTRAFSWLKAPTSAFTFKTLTNPPVLYDFCVGDPISRLLRGCPYITSAAITRQGHSECLQTLT